MDDSTPATPAGAMAAIPSSAPPELALKCCCGRPDCIFLKHNCSVLDTVEKDVQAAARMGQVLLARHEAYMADAERDRAELTTKIGKLEVEKRGLEADNAKTIEENRRLLQELEELNNSFSDSEIQITTLEAELQAALHTSEVSVRRLDGATARAVQLERELKYLEQEQEQIQNDLFSSRQDARTATQRWKAAERGIASLQEQLEKIEREANEERERHAEVVERMQKQRAMEKDLDAAAGRLKGAAAARQLSDGRGTNPAVSHFVRDLLQDNMNLQLGTKDLQLEIEELREMLSNSNIEIQRLREHIMHHQPDGEASVGFTLSAELGPLEEEYQQPERATPTQVQHKPKLSQELHIHHHYHVKPEIKKPKKKRLSSTVFSPPLRCPSTPPGGYWRLNQASPAPALLSHAHRDSVSTIPSHRWSVFSGDLSDAAPSSVPTSPRSNYGNPMFGRGMVEESYPTSPTTSADPMSPRWENMHRKHASDASALSFQPLHLAQPTTSISSVLFVEPEVSQERESNHDSHDVSHDMLKPTVDFSVTDSSTERGSVTSLEVTRHPLSVSTTSCQGIDEDSASITPTSTTGGGNPSRRLHRTASHESIISLSGGLDIHTLKTRPSQLTLRHLGSAAAADTGLSAVVARPTLARVMEDDLKRGSAVLRDSLSHGLPLPRARVASAGHSPASSAASSLAAGITPRHSSSSALGRLASWRPWGASAPLSTSPSLSPKPSSITSIRETVVTVDAATEASASSSLKSPTTPSSTKSPRDQRDFSRPVGINQAGAIPGFQEYFAAHQRRVPPNKVTPDVVDREALREVLDGD